MIEVLITIFLAIGIVAGLIFSIAIAVVGIIADENPAGSTEPGIKLYAPLGMATAFLCGYSLMVLLWD